MGEFLDAVLTFPLMQRAVATAILASVAAAVVSLAVESMSFLI